MHFFIMHNQITLMDNSLKELLHQVKGKYPAIAEKLPPTEAAFKMHQNSKSPKYSKARIKTFYVEGNEPLLLAVTFQRIDGIGHRINNDDENEEADD